MLSMEEALVVIEKERRDNFPVQHHGTDHRPLPPTNHFLQASSDFVRALQELAEKFSFDNNHYENNVDIESTAAANNVSDEDATMWLYNLSATVPSPLDVLPLSTAILNACKYEDEMQIQSALFDTLGESERALEVLFQIVPKAREISSSVTEEKLRRFHTTGASEANSIMSPELDPELEALDKLRRDAMEKAQYVALLKSELGLDEDTQIGPSKTTHTVKRTSDKAAMKMLKKAEKQAAAALDAAREVGAIIADDEHYDAAALMTEAMNRDITGLHQMTESEFRQFQASLLPENTLEYHEQKRLPAGTLREYFEGYEMVTIPASVKDPSELHRRILLEEVMNKYEMKAFAGTRSLNPMQSAVFKAAFLSNENLLICAPTGAGKTNVAMLTVVAHLRDKGIIRNESDPYTAYQNSNSGQGTAGQIGKKIVYIAPMKALAQEVTDKFSSKLKALGIVVRELTGDMQLSRTEAERADILVTTPEKWDVVTRKGGDGSLGQTCGLLIIDEVHLLADERGAVIESVVARLHRLVESSQRQVRIVGLSATLPNYKDVAKFLRVDQRRGLFHFGPEHRPVPLQQQFVGVTETKNRFKKEQIMNEICYNVVSDSLRRGYQVMVFVHSRRGTGDTIEALTAIAQKRNELEQLFITKGSEDHNDAHSRYVDRAEKSRNRELTKHFRNGMGIHHAGMLRADRKLTEQMFSDGAIKVLCCTATLAWGINLPAHTVVVKGTEVYNPEKGGAVDLSILDVQQIFGRAGRPQFDTSGEATLITTQDALARYLDKLVRDVPIESSFIKQLADHLNAEIANSTVTTLKEAAEWLQYTYLHVRMMRNPIAYGINATEMESDPLLTNRSLELVKEASKTLDSYRMIRYDAASGNLSVTDLGRVASQFYIRAESVSRFNQMLQRNVSPSDADLVGIICNAHEFENVKVRPEELDEIDKLKKDDCPLGVKIPVEEFSGKCSVLMQSYISCAKVNSFTLISDTNYIASNAGRVARALFEMCLKKGRAGAALALLRIAKSCDRRIWWFQTPLRQFEGELNQHIFRALESKLNGPITERDAFYQALCLLDMQPGEVGSLCHSNKDKHKILNLAKLLPYVDIQCHVQPVTRSILRFQITLTPSFNWNQRWHGSAQGFWLWIEDSDNSRIYHQEYILFSKRTHPDSINLELVIPAFDPLPPQYFIRVVSDSWVGSEFLLPVSFEHLFMPSTDMPYTDLMDLTPLPTSALGNSKYEQLYSKFEVFNPIQTQLFHALYHQDTPILLGAPTGSGKTIVAEITLLRMKKKFPSGKCVYIAPLKSLARERLKEWKKKLGGDPLKWKVLELSGDTHHDKRTLEKADVLVCTPEKWDLVSRGWRTPSEDVVKSKNFVKDVRLLIIDEIHLLGEERGAVLEAIVSRTRFISRLIQSQASIDENEISVNQSHETTRIVGLSTAIANPYDLANWMGIDVDSIKVGAKIGMYNFRPSVRPIPMKVHIQGFAGRHYCPRMATMNKPCYAAIREHSPTKPVIIFVASRRQTRLTALDLINYAASDQNPSAFLGCNDEYALSVADTLHDASLRHTISYGIGLHHAGLSSHDREKVENMFLKGDIQVLVATATLAWGVNLPAHLVIVKGTEFFDGKESRYVDYPVTDVLQMMGRAGRPQFDTEGIACIFVEESKKNFYKKFLYDPFPVESCLDSRMADNLNAEIATGTVVTIEDCVGWLDWTFYARRVRMNPSYYGAESGDDDTVNEFLLQKVMKCIEELKESGCIITPADDNMGEVAPTYLGVTSSKFYLHHKTPHQMRIGCKHSRRSILSSLKHFDCHTGEHGFAFPVEVEEAVVASIIYHLAHTYEFSELPVRHNEEQLNAQLADQLPWGPLIPVIDQGELRKNNNIDIETYLDPCTKCYLLIQAFIIDAELPISDYVNDTSTVLDQLPRLLAAMENVAMHDMSSEGTFDMYCMFPIVRQILNSRMLPSEDPLGQVYSISDDKMRQLREQGITLRKLCLMEDYSSLRLTKKVQQEIHLLPLFTLCNIQIAFKTDKASGKSEGVVSFNLELHQKVAENRKTSVEFSFDAIIGTHSQSILLGQKNITLKVLPHSSGERSRSIEIKFDWDIAKSSNQEDGSSVVLRVFSRDVRGLDVQHVLPLNVAPQK